MSDLAEFLLVRIAEDEERAQERMCHAQEHHLLLQDPKYLGRVIPGWYEWPEIEADAARLLAECEPKRRIVAWHRMIDGLDRDDNPVRGCGNCIASGAVPPYLIAGPCMTVRLLALPYAEHPDYREEWRP